MAETDDATNALIAKLLSEDNGYGSFEYQNEYGQDDSDDSDFGGSKKRRKTGKKEEDAQAGTEQFSATGRRKRKDTGANREKSRGWSEEEEKLFLEALELHGRNWKACAAHVGTRDARAFTSHAQKYFIKMCLAGKRLPAKVAESGEGYTLSGKPLDPNSAAAKAYGFKPDTLAKLQSSGAGELPGLAKPSDENLDGNADKGSGGGAPAPRALAQPGETEALASKNKRAKPAPKKVEAASESEEDEAELACPEPTEYAKNRPRREAAGPRNTLGHTTESLELCRLVDYVGPPGSGAPLAQPFSVEVSAQVHLLMDFHAHLSNCEIIGLLGGAWDPDKRAISVSEAFPCRRADGSHSGTSVELDPAAEVETRALMEQRGLHSVGWYHSHPVFAPRPSQKDNENQRNYQALFRCEKSKLEPFLGAIVGPYDTQLPTQASALTWFVVQTKAGELTPFSIRHSVKALEGLPGEYLEAQLHRVADMFREDYGRVDLSAMWRPFTRFLDGQPEGPPCSKLAKLQAALRCHLPKDQRQSGGADALLARLARHLQTTWGLDLGCKADAEAGTEAQPAEAAAGEAPGDAEAVEGVGEQEPAGKADGAAGAMEAADPAAAQQ
ncbi:hypothetical protein WJX72_007805 [[Myrmecia] bisecta]|uniref:Myb-like, SWIRM and MPN domain-containing protein 1 n=1 Tax=[Myrmecia] bisecta TaxID=41462 RepID=A0AAW1Q4Q3_9CHLO